MSFYFFQQVGKMTSYYLVEILPEDWKNLQKLYTRKELRNGVTFCTIGNYIRFYEQDSKIKHIKFYCLNGNFSDGTFVVIVSCLIIVKVI